jgi:hypothetical protein
MSEVNTGRMEYNSKEMIPYQVVGKQDTLENLGGMSNVKVTWKEGQARSKCLRMPQLLYDW